MLAGCSTPHLREQAISVGHSAGSIYTSQVLENLYNTAEENDAIPSLFSFSKGSIQTSNTISPTVNIPIGDTRTQTLVAGNLGVSQLVGNAQGISIGASEVWQQSWDISPEKNPLVLWTLNLVYNYVLGDINDADSRLNAITPQQRKSEQPRAPKPPSLQTCSITLTSAKCQSENKLPPSIPSDDTKALIKSIFDRCARCFRRKDVGTKCLEPKEVMTQNDSGKATGTDQWVCLGIYSSLDERIVGHEMMISESAYREHVLLDLVVLSLQVQFEASKGSSSS
jgi:hypothetical protein